MMQGVLLPVPWRLQPASAMNSYCAVSPSNLTATVSDALSSVFLNVVRQRLRLLSDHALGRGQGEFGTWLG
jgi:hypothetical protein